MDRSDRSNQFSLYQFYEIRDSREIFYLESSILYQVTIMGSDNQRTWRDWYGISFDVYVAFRKERHNFCGFICRSDNIILDDEKTLYSYSMSRDD